MGIKWEIALISTLFSNPRNPYIYSSFFPIEGGPFFDLWKTLETGNLTAVLDAKTLQNNSINFHNVFEKNSQKTLL